MVVDFTVVVVDFAAVVVVVVLFLVVLVELATLPLVVTEPLLLALIVPIFEFEVARLLLLFGGALEVLPAAVRTCCPCWAKAVCARNSTTTNDTRNCIFDTSIFSFLKVSGIKNIDERSRAQNTETANTPNRAYLFLSVIKKSVGTQPSHTSLTTSSSQFAQQANSPTR